MIIERDLRVRIGADARRIAELALMEDGIRDITSEACVAPGQFATALIRSRAPASSPGTAYVDAVIITCGLEPIVWYQPSGTAMEAGAHAGVVQGDLAAILRAERPLLNLLQRAVGIANRPVPTSMRWRGRMPRSCIPARPRRGSACST